MSEAMRRDDDVFIMGEDIAEMGGSMGVTQGMLEEFGPERVRNSPISEMAIVGAGIGAAVVGMRPIVEIDRKSTRLNSSHSELSRMPSSA